MIRAVSKRLNSTIKTAWLRNMSTSATGKHGKFAGKVVVVTGGGQGIGRAICYNYAKEGAHVGTRHRCQIIAERDIEAGKEVESKIRSTHGEDSATFVDTDVGSDVSIASMVDIIRSTYKKVDIVINNAGIAKWCEISEENALAHFDMILGVNLRGSYAVTKHLLPLMIEDSTPGRSIINIASTRALMSEPNAEAYAASKGGILSLTHALAVSLAKHNIRVNAISPGWIDVQDYRKSSSILKDPTQQLRAEDHAQHPAGRVGVPDDVAAACLFLTAPDASFITGQNLVIDGGMTKKMIYLED